MPDPKPKRDLAADAHFRLDEHHRRLDDLEKGTSEETVNGIVLALRATLKSDTEEMLQAIREDVKVDRDVVKAIGELVDVIKQLIQARA